MALIYQKESVIFSESKPGDRGFMSRKRVATLRGAGGGALNGDWLFIIQAGRLDYAS